MMATTYQAPDYDDKKYRSGVNTDYYTKAVETYKTEQGNTACRRTESTAVRT